MQKSVQMHEFGDDIVARICELYEMANVHECVVDMHKSATKRELVEGVA